MLHPSRSMRLCSFCCWSDNVFVPSAMHQPIGNGRCCNFQFAVDNFLLRNPTRAYAFFIFGALIVCVHVPPSSLTKKKNLHRQRFLPQHAGGAFTPRPTEPVIAANPTPPADPAAEGQCRDTGAPPQQVITNIAWVLRYPLAVFVGRI